MLIELGKVPGATAKQPDANDEIRSQAGEGFIKGTRVHTKDGLKPIEEIKVGDWVLTQPGEGGERTYKRVTRTTRFEDAVVWSVFYLPNAERERAKAEGRKVQKESYRRLVITPNHPLWVKGKGWVQVKDLNFDGDEFELCNGDNAGLVQVSPLYRSHTDDIAWQEGIFDETDGQLIDLRNGAPGEFDVFRQQLFQPDFVELWDESCYYRCPVYNFEVEDCHTCYIGAEGVWVNNSNCEGTTSTKNAQNLPDARCVENEQREGNSEEKGAGFVAGTLVHTREGSKSIEQIKVGDWVLTQPETTGERIYKRVTRITHLENAVVWTVSYYLKSELDQARAEGRTMPPDASRRLVVTPNHSFWVKDKGWVQVKDLWALNNGQGFSDESAWAEFEGYEFELADGASALLADVYPLYRSGINDVAWLEGMFLPDSGTLVDLRNGKSGEDAFRSRGALPAFQPSEVERWDESFFFRCSVYNIEVEDFHTYYVGELGVWVHNSNCSENSPSQMEQPMSAARRSTQAGGCFIKGTRVHTKEGLKSIEQIRTGDWVLTQPEETGERTYKRVIRTNCCEDVPVWALTYFRSSELERAKAENRMMPLGLHRRLVVTPNHPLWVRNKGWVQVKNLDFDSDELLLSDGEYARLVEVSPLYRTGAAGIAWQADTVISKTGRGQLLDLRNGASAEFEEYRDEADPQSFSYWDESCYIQKIKLSDGSCVYAQEAMRPRDIEEWNESFYYRCTVYNFEVEDCHTYYVGTEGVWAHNTNCGKSVSDLAITQRNSLEPNNRAGSGFAKSETRNLPSLISTPCDG
ncbi:Hint domain-containing protein [Pseudomonas indica]|uniref:Hint domain-containing protein n=1 Tax=Pseudomonas indica TaxID=137658 RepID=UPI003FD679E9